MAFQNGVSSLTKAQLHVETDQIKPIKVVSFSSAQNGTQNGAQNGASFAPVFPGCYADLAPGWPGMTFKTTIN